MDMSVVDFFGLCHTLDHQDHGAAHGRNVDGFKGGIQNQNRVLHDRWFARRRRNGAGWALLSTHFRQEFRPGSPTTMAKFVHSSGS
jgi:hypothetical protein